MNRLDRLFSILLHLQYKQLIRAQDLAEKFNVSKRTIYRDITTLSLSGVPIVSMPGEGYTLANGYFLPPLIFSRSEAEALVLGTQMLLQQAEGSLITGAKDALEKIIAVLPATTRRQVEQLTALVQFITPESRFNLDDHRLSTLQQAIQKLQVVHLRYHSFRENLSTERDIEPHRLYYADGVWYVWGFCRLRQEMRAFRLERIEQLHPLKKTFTRTEEISSHLEKINIHIRFATNIVRWVREQQHYTFLGEDLVSEDGVVMTYLANDPKELKSWVLGWGASAEVLEPIYFREEILQEAKKIINLLT